MKSDLQTELRSEASAADAGVFSPALHARTLERLRTARPEAAIDGLLPRRRRRTAPIVASLAVACLVGGVTFRSVSRHLTPAEPPTQFIPLVAELRDSARPIADAFAEPARVAGDQLALLRDDARRAGRFFAAQIPSLPDDAKVN